MGAAQDDGIDERVGLHQLVDVFLHEVVGPRPLRLALLHQRHPEGAWLPGDADVRVQFLYLQAIAVALDGALGGQYAHVAGGGQLADDFGRGPDDAQHAAVYIPAGQVVLLYGAQRLGRGSVASQHHQVAAAAEEVLHGLARELVDHAKRAWPIGGTGIVAQIQIVVLGQLLAYGVEDG